MSNKSTSQICPWCQAEILWDPEIGPEDVCPHCSIELGDYRTVPVGNEADKNAQDEEDSEVEDILAPENIIEDVDNQVMDDFADVEDLFQYESTVEKFIDAQDHTPDCPNCQDYMVFAGEQEMTQENFSLFESKEVGKSFLEFPFSLELYVCPSCFQTKTILSHETRLQVINKLNK